MLIKLQYYVYTAPTTLGEGGKKKVSKSCINTDKTYFIVLQ